MTIKAFLDGLPDNVKGPDGQTLRQQMAATCSIWDNNACKGYCIAALQAAGFGPDAIGSVLEELTAAFDELAVEDAAAIYAKYHG